MLADEQIAWTVELKITHDIHQETMFTILVSSSKLSIFAVIHTVTNPYRVRLRMSSSPQSERDIRNAILLESEKLFREKMYSCVSTNEISKCLGISKKTLYKVFSTKEEILRTMVESAGREINQRLDAIYEDSTLTFVERVLSCLGALKYMHQHVSPQKLMQDIQRNAPQAWMDVRSMMHQRVSVVAQFIQNGRAEMAVRDDVSADLVALIYMNSTGSIMDDRVLKGISIERDRLFHCFTELFYMGMFSEEARSSLEKTRQAGHQLKRIPTIAELRAESGESLSLSEQIIDVSRDLFFRFGYSKIRMDEIAAELRISKKTLYNHFSGKEDVLRSVLKRFADDIERAHHFVDNSSCDSFISSLRSFVMYMAKMLGEITPQFVRDLLRSSPHLWEALHDWRSQAIDNTFSDLLVQGQKLGAIRSDFSSAELSQTYRVAVDASLNPEVLAMTAYRAIDLYKAVVNAMFIGILRDESRSEFQAKSRLQQEQLHTREFATHAPTTTSSQE